jgi:hypothetical protein
MYKCTFFINTLFVSEDPCFTPKMNNELGVGWESILIEGHQQHRTNSAITQEFCCSGHYSLSDCQDKTQKSQSITGDQAFCNHEP